MQSPADDAERVVTIHLVRESAFDAFVEVLSPSARTWLESTGFKAGHRKLALLPNAQGRMNEGIFVLEQPGNAFDAAALAAGLPEDLAVEVEDPEGLIAPLDLLHGFGLAAWRFTRYLDNGRKPARLVGQESTLEAEADCVLQGIALARDLVNTPANDMGPDELEAAVRELSTRFCAQVEVVRGDDLIERNFPAIHAVGRASPREPRLLDLRWGREDAPKVTLVGKGVCFDTGGLDLKPPSAMLNMKKDMGGAAVMIGLARAIMARDLDIRLRLIVAAVENSVAGNAFRPGDVIATRKGLSVEIGNTDAEGRLVLADALALADEEKPALLIDAATLTGAARVALGTELPALFTDDAAIARELDVIGEELAEPLWRLPLYRGYERLLKSQIADINNTGSKPYGGAITAALFLKRFVARTEGWAHLDIFGWNDEASPGRPKGGEATALRPLFELIRRRWPR